MTQTRAARDQQNDTSDFPPVIACASCGSPTCDGCPQPDRMDPRSARSPLRWEAESRSFRSLVETSLLSVEQPDVTFGATGSMTWGRALSFAFLCETFALCSFGILGLLLGYLVMPLWTTQLLLTPSFWPAAGVLLSALVAGMVTIHLAWGRLLEQAIAAQGRPAEKLQGLCFGLYACGWDFITSPMGITCALLLRGRGAGGALLAALRVPSQAMGHYLRGRGLDEPERKAALRHVTRALLRGAIGALVLLLAAGVSALIYIWP